MKPAGLFAQEQYTWLKLYNTPNPPQLFIGKDESSYFLQQYVQSNSSLQEYFKENNNFYLITEKFKTHVSFTKLGVNNFAPQATLDVDGSIRANSSLVMLGPGSYKSDRFQPGPNGKRGLYIDNDSSYSWEFLSFRNLLGEQLRIEGNGYTGLGTVPGYRLHIKQKDGSFAEGIGITNGATTWNIVSDGIDGERLLITSNHDQSKGVSIINGNVGVGMNAPPGYKMVVDGTFGARKVRVTQSPTWADFVFAPDYELIPLPDLERFVQENRHLPGIPTEKDVKANGVDLGEMNAKLLQKVEELTLYIIRQDKDMAKIRAELDELKKAR